MNPKLFFMLLSTLFVALAQAQTTGMAPDALVKIVTNEVLQVIRGDKEIKDGNSKKVMDLITAKVQQHFDFTHMTRLGVGRDWKKANPAQQKQLADEFHTLLVRTYAKALTEYKNQTIEFKPFKMNAADTDVKVRTQVAQAGSKSIPLDYYLEKMPAGWKVYDIEVEGISLVINYRESFAAEVRSGGIDGLIKSLQGKNKTGAGGDKK
ncbi:MAG: ABC transporter substrate-binding protein [Sterolibacterium sp.]|nr:ABC transporter substrate-binding protein [Sterolibacterium sp.]